MKINRLLVVIAALVLLVAAGNAYALTVGQTYKVNAWAWDGLTSPTFTVNGGADPTYAARPDLQLQMWDGAALVGSATWIEALCISPQAYATNPGGTVYTLRKGWSTSPIPGEPPSGAGVKDATAWKYLTWMAYSTSDWGNPSGGIGVSNASKRASAMQLAAWELLRGDTTFDVSISGGTGFYTSPSTSFASDVLSDAQGLWNLGMAAPSWWSGSEYLWLSDSGQDFLVKTVPYVPEIPAAALAPLGLAAFGLIRRKIAR